MFAEAMGFDSTASSAELLAAALKRLGETTEALQTARTSGAVGELPQLMEDEQILRQYIAELTPAQQAQEELNLSTRNFVGLIRQVSPGLAFYVEGLFRSVHVVGQLANKNLELGSALKGAGNFIKENAASLALLGAGGAVVFGINAITGAWEQMRKEGEKVAEMLKKQAEAANKLREGQDEQRGGIAKLSDARREGRMSASEETKAQQEAETIGKRFGGEGGLDKDSINKAEALLAGKGFSIDEVARAVFLMQTPGAEGKPMLELDPRASAARLRAAFERASRRYQKPVEAFFAERPEVAQERAKEAVALLTSASDVGMNVPIKESIQGLPGKLAEGMDPDRAAAIVAGLKAKKGQRGSNVEWGWWRDLSGMGEEMLATQYTPFSDLTAKARLLENEGFAKDVHPAEIRIGEIILQQLEKMEKRQNVTVNYTEAHRKMIVPGQRAREEASMNGAARARLAEE